QGELELSFRFVAGAKRVASIVRLKVVPDQPRPAGYALNGLPAERRVRVSDYAFTFEDGARSVPVPDPMAALAGKLVATLVSGVPAPDAPRIAPVSINLDLTTACNYRCDHCIDWDILNTPNKYEEEKLRSSIAEMRERGLKSVILIGGGEPTVYPGFSGMVRYL